MKTAKAIPIAFIVGFLAGAGTIAAIAAIPRAVRENEPLHPKFPVVVVSSDQSKFQCKVVFAENLGDYPKGEWSYVVPQSRQELCLSQIAAQSDPDSRSKLSVGYAYAEIGPVTDGKQRYGVFAIWSTNWFNRSRYIATEEEIVPLTHQFFRGPTTVLYSLFIGLVMGILAVVIASLLAFIRRSRQ